MTLSHRKHRWIFLLLVVAYAMLSSGCGKSYLDNIKRGSGYNFMPGYPELRLDVAGFIDEAGNPKINVAGDVVYSSLIFKKSEEQFKSDVLLEVFVFGKDGRENYARSYAYGISIVLDDYMETISQNVHSFDKEIEVPHGEFDVRVKLTDQASGKEVIISEEAFIPNPDNNVSNITNVRILVKNSSSDIDFMPVTTYDLTSDVDSVKFTFQVTNNDPASPISIHFRLLKFNSDTSLARAMSFSDYSPTRLNYYGISYSEYEVIQSSIRTLTQPGSVFIELVYPNLDRGNYRFEVDRDLSEKSSLYKARDFGIKSENYPLVKTPRELARPLYYLMNEKDYENLMSIQSPDSLKKAMDHFWLSNIGNAALARSVISLYYERVEEANKQFSNYKEGWKTDPGMIYILFGPPRYVEKRLDMVKWSYVYNLSDPQYNFIFEIPKLSSRYYPFYNYVLKRKLDYFNVDYSQRQLWLSGEILRTNL